MESKQYQSDLELGWEREAFLHRVPWLKQVGAKDWLSPKERMALWAGKGRSDYHF